MRRRVRATVAVIATIAAGCSGSDSQGSSDVGDEAPTSSASADEVACSNAIDLLLAEVEELPATVDEIAIDQVADISRRSTETMIERACDTEYGDQVDDALCDYLSTSDAADPRQIALVETTANTFCTVSAVADPVVTAVDDEVAAGSTTSTPTGPTSTDTTDPTDTTTDDDADGSSDPDETIATTVPSVSTEPGVTATTAPTGDLADDLPHSDLLADPDAVPFQSLGDADDWIFESEYRLGDVYGGPGFVRGINAVLPDGAGILWNLLVVEWSDEATATDVVADVVAAGGRSAGADAALVEGLAGVTAGVGAAGRYTVVIDTIEGVDDDAVEQALRNQLALLAP